MGWGSPKDAFGSVGGGNIVGGGASKDRAALSDYNRSSLMNLIQLNQKYDAANKRLTDTMSQARDTTKQGYGRARTDTTEGYTKARGEYDKNPSIVASRRELYDRIMGKGGFSPETVNAMKGSTIEQAGTQMRDVQNALQDRFGDSTGSGMTGENLARALTTIGANKASALRDVDLNNAMLAEQQQSEAMPMAYQDASTMTGLDLGEARDLSGLDTGESNAIAELLAKEGIGGAGLTTEMAKALAELESNRASSNLQVGTQKNLLQSLWG